MGKNIGFSSSAPLVRPKSAIPPLLETTRVSDIIIWECHRPPNRGGGGGGLLGRSCCIPVTKKKPKPTRSHPSRYFVHCVCSLLDRNAGKVHIYRELTGDHDQMECSEKLLHIYSRFSFFGNVSSKML